MLVVARTFPWPATSGGRMRVANTIKALLPLGDVDVFVASRSADEPESAPGSDAVRRVGVTPYPASSLSRAGLVRWYAGSTLPLELVGRDFSPVRRAFANFVAAERYDLVWVSRLPTFVAVGHLPAAPVIVDVDDLRGDWHSTRLTARKGDVDRSRLKRRLIGRVVGRNVSLWERLQAEVAADARAMVVCSGADLVRSQLPNARVVPNGYDRPARPVGKVSVSDPPTIVFQGGLHYPPNVDAASHLVERILPLVRQKLPDVQVRLVGAAAPGVEKLGLHRGVVVTGWVQRVEAELERADLIAVPIRFGGGTRIKILEAFAHRIPVVSTSRGAYGLDVIDGRHLLLADTPDAFAEACVTLLTDEDVRRNLADRAEELFLEKYQWSHISSSIRELALSVA